MLEHSENLEGFRFQSSLIISTVKIVNIDGSNKNPQKVFDIFYTEKVVVVHTRYTRKIIKIN